MCKMGDARIRMSLAGACLAAVAWVGAAQGQFTLQSAATLGVVARPGGVVIGDWNGDQRPDLAVAVDTPDRVDIFLNTGGGWTFTRSVFTGAGTGPDHLAAADLDGNQTLDLAVTLHNANSVLILRGNGLGQFSTTGPFAVQANPRFVVIGDWNGNQSPDLAVVNRDGNSITILSSAGLGQFTLVGHVTVGEEPRSAAAGDFDGDADLDLAVTNHRDRSVSILMNVGGAFSVTATMSVGTQLRPDGITAAKLDSGDSVDLAAATSGNGLNLVSVFRNTGAGTFTGPTNFAVGGTNPGSIVSADMNCDGRTDLMTANEDSASISIVPNQGNAAFGASMQFNVGTTPQGLAVGDTDGDGDPDLAVSARDSNSVSVLTNTTCAVECATPGDVDGDGRVNGRDVAGFVACTNGVGGCACADMNASGGTDAADVPVFLAALLRT